MSDDLVRRWREAKLGERRGDRVAVWVECEGDPRAEVLAALQAQEAAALLAMLPPAQPLKSGAVIVAVAEHEAEIERARAEHAEIALTGTVTIAEPPPRRSRKRGGKS